MTMTTIDLPYNKSDARAPKCSGQALALTSERTSILARYLAALGRHELSKATRQHTASIHVLK